MALIRMQALEEILKSTILTAKVAREDVRPLSVFLIAKPERGKTSVALRVAGNNSVVVTDMTAIGILETLQRHQNATHVILGDLMAVQGHKHSVSSLTVTMLNALAEEGTYSIAVPRLQHLEMKGRKVGIIACGTPDMMEDNRVWWKCSGFYSRLLVLHFEHSAELIKAVLQNIASDNGRNSPSINGNALRVPGLQTYVTISTPIAQKIMLLASITANKFEEVGYRKQKQFRALVCGHALLRSWKKPQVIKEDVDWLETVIPFLDSERPVEL